MRLSPLRGLGVHWTNNVGAARRLVDCFKDEKGKEGVAQLAPTPSRRKADRQAEQGKTKDKLTPFWTALLTEQN